MNEETHSLLHQYLDDRDGMSEDDLQRLADALRDSPEIRRRLHDQLVVEELIAQKLGVDRRNFPAQVRQRVHDDSRQDSLERQVRDMQSLANAELDQWSERQQGRRRRSWRRRVALGVLAAIAVIAGGLAYREYGPVARITAVRGRVTLIRDGKQMDVQPGARLFDGDRIKAEQPVDWRLEFADRSVLAARGPIDLQLTGRRTQAKTITVNQGDLTADVERQPPGAPMRFITPMADAVVLGTELFLLVDEQATRLDVVHGRVRLEQGGDAVLVETARFARAVKGELNEGRQQWPMSQNALVLQSAFARAAEVTIHQDGQATRTPLASRGEAKFNESLALGGGAFMVAPDVAESVIQRCQTANAITLEVWLKQGQGIQPASARIVTIGSQQHDNFLLTAANDTLTLQLASSSPKPVLQSPIHLCRWGSAEWRHLVIAYGDGGLDCYLDGSLVKSLPWDGDLSPWQSGYMAFGDDWEGDGSLAWAGEIGAVAVYARRLSAHEAYRNWRQLRDRQRHLKR